MNVLSSLPKWAQAPAQSFLKQQKIEGTEVKPLDQDTFESMTQLAGGILVATTNDEVAGEDEAMGKPGVVVSNGLTINFEGDASSSTGRVQAVATAVDNGSEIAILVNSTPRGFSTLQMAKGADGKVGIEGGEVRETANGLGGYIVSGQAS